MRIQTAEFVFAAVLMVGCHPGWRVGALRETPKVPSSECVREALLAHPSVIGVILERSPQRTNLGKVLTAPTQFRAETKIGVALVLVSGDGINVSFGGVGLPPGKVSDDGPPLVNDMADWLVSRCVGPS